MDRLEIAGHHDLHESLTAAKMVVYRSHVRSRSLRDVPHGYHFKAVISKQRLCSINQAQLRTLFWNKRSLHTLRRFG